MYECKNVVFGQNLRKASKPSYSLVLNMCQFFSLNHLKINRLKILDTAVFRSKK